MNVVHNRSVLTALFLCDSGPSFKIREDNEYVSCASREKDK